MSYQASIYDGSTWQTLGFQIPQTPVYGDATATITANPTSKSVTFTTAFGSGVTPFVFIQPRTAGGSVTVTARSNTGFTVSIAGLTSGSYDFSWSAVAG